jgi:hypothetical protein
MEFSPSCFQAIFFSVVKKRAVREEEKRRKERKRKREGKGKEKRKRL